MSGNFSIGYRCNLVFYIVECVVVILMGFINNYLSLELIGVFAAYALVTSLVLYRGKKKFVLSEYAHCRAQCVLFVVVNIFLSISFDSAQVFMYAMYFSTIACYIFLDNKLVKFQFIQSLILIVVVAGFLSVYIGSKQTMQAFTFGSVVLIVMNTVILVMTSMINFQTRTNIEQERSLDDLLKVVEAKRIDAQAATNSKTRFLAHMSHEIRTPINAVIGMNEMILRESSEQDICDYASDAKGAAQSLLGIINDILDITKIEAGKLTLLNEDIKISDIISDVYNVIRFRADAKNLKLILDIDSNLPTVIKGDDVRLKQVLINILSNAVKYTHQGSVTLSVRLLDKERILFSVKDTGIGIKEDDIALLFNAFERIEENRNRNIEGTGLGLNITASMLKLFGSELKVESVYGEGSVFSFELCSEIVDATPMGEIDLTARQYEHKEYHSSYEAPSANVLVVDDNDMNRKVFIQLLKKTKVNICEAASGKECLEITSKERFDIIFMDHMMPEMDGIETFNAIRADADNKCVDVPVVVLTANAISGAKESYLKAGFNDFLTKPVDPSKLESTLFSMLDKGLVIKTKTDVSDENDRFELPMIEGVDWGYARLHFNNDDIMLETVKMFRISIKNDINELNIYFDEIEQEEARSNYQVKVHSMKSSAAIIGIVHLAGMAMELEKAAKCGDIDIIRHLHPIFIERWLTYYALLEPLSVDENDTPKISVDGNEETIKEIFADIRTAAEEMDVDALDMLSSKLDEYDFGGDFEKVNSIKNSILNFEIEKLVTCEYWN